VAENLTKKQEAFCREYIIDLNATQAAIRAGYSVNAANRTAFNLLTKTDIQSSISELMAERSRVVKADANYVLRRLVEIDEMDVADILTDSGDIKPIKEWPKVWRTTLSAIDIQVINSGDIEAITKKIKWPDKLRNLELLGKHVNVNAFAEKAMQGGAEDLAESIGKLIDRLPS
jgi:phage terminase small subunit